jgi:hypothetical protein
MDVESAKGSIRHFNYIPMMKKNWSSINPSAFWFCNHLSQTIGLTNVDNGGVGVTSDINRLYARRSFVQVEAKATIDIRLKATPAASVINLTLSAYWVSTKIPQLIVLTGAKDGNKRTQNPD